LRTARGCLIGEVAKTVINIELIAEIIKNVTDMEIEVSIVVDIAPTGAARVRPWHSRAE
jgi:hypothetical protein